MSNIVENASEKVNAFLSPSQLNAYLKLTTISVVMGSIIGFASVVVHELYHYMHMFTEYIRHVNEFFVVIIPVVGITVAYKLVTKYSTTKQSGGGSHRLLEAYHFEGGIMSRNDTLFDPLAASLTIGSGGSAGFEGPSLLLGGGLGSLIAQRLNLDKEEIQSFLLSGAAAGVSAIFKAPFTGIMFALEIPYKRDMSRKTFIPATIASISSYIVAVNFLGTEPAFHLSNAVVQIEPISMVHAILIGIITSIFGVLFVKSFEVVKKMKESTPINQIFFPIIGGLCVGVTGLFLPEVMGVGYESINAVLSGEANEWSTGFLWALVIMKIVLTCITLTSGGSGGVFIPNLFVGAMLGALYLRIFPVPFGEILIVAAMASIMAAANKTLLTSVAFVAETAGPSSIIFTLTAAATSYFISRDASFYSHVQPVDEFSDEEEALHTLYHYIIKKKDPTFLHLVKAEDIMDRETVVLKENMKIKEALTCVQACDKTEYPIIRRNKIVGVTTLDSLLTFPEEKHKLQIGLLPMDSPHVISKDLDFDEALEEYLTTNASCLWVVDDLKSMKLVGVISEEEFREKLMELL